MFKKLPTQNSSPDDKTIFHREASSVISGRFRSIFYDVLIDVGHILTIAFDY